VTCIDHEVPRYVTSYNAHLLHPFMFKYFPEHFSASRSRMLGALRLQSRGATLSDTCLCSSLKYAITFHIHKIQAAELSLSLS